MCQFMADPGPCRGKISVYGYDPFMNSCNYFNYGGCGGNPNRFTSYSDCHKACIMTRNIYEGGDKNKSEENQTDTSVDYYGEQTDEPDNPDETENPDSGEYGDGEDADGDGDGDGDEDGYGDADGEDEDNQGETPEPDPEMEPTTQNIEDVDGSNDFNETDIMQYDIGEMENKFNESVKEEIEQEYIDNLEEAKENDSEEREVTENEKGIAELT